MNNCFKCKKRNYSKRNLIVLFASLLLIVAVVTSTLTWLTIKDQKVNQFTVGSFSNPEVPDPNNPEQNIPLDGYIYEEEWDKNTDDHKLIPGQTTIKDPKVGIGNGSEDAYAYIYIDNEYGQDVYFMLDNEWEAIEGKAEAKTDVSGAYCSGLFRFKSILCASEDDAWTSKIFTEVHTDSNVERLEAKKMTVHCFIHQAKNGTNTLEEDTVDAAAIAWTESEDGPQNSGD